MTHGNFEVEVLGINRRRELCTQSFVARPVSDGPYQPVDVADVRRRVLCLGHVKIMNLWSGTAACYGLRWSTRVVCVSLPSPIHYE